MRCIRIGTEDAALCPDGCKPAPVRSNTALVTTGVFAGLCIGLGVYTFAYARGYSYATDNPSACANCHVMQEYYSGWMKSGHAAVATCNDCHTPHNPAGKYAVKTVNGFRHSFAFTTGRFPDNLRIAGFNQRVTEGACRACHGQLTASIRGAHGGNDVSCVRCHFTAGHS